MDANPTLDQLQVFLTVAETGSFSAASRALNRAQSVVSYTIANLEAQLEVSLFERNGVRQPRLTDEGRAMLEDARRIVAGLQEMRARAKGLKQGLEAGSLRCHQHHGASGGRGCGASRFSQGIPHRHPQPQCG